MKEGISPEEIERRRRKETPTQHPRKTERENAKLKEQQGVEELTGLLTQKAFRERMTSLIEKFKGRRESDFLQKVSFLLIDVDKFKEVNDTYGHPVGDQALQLVADAIRKHVRKDTDFAARWAGDEFAVCYEDAGEGIGEIAEAILKEVNDSTITLPNGQKVQVTISIGIAETTGYRTVDRLYMQADKALYDSKEEGRNRFVIAGLPHKGADEGGVHIAV
ncbi:GGDEF domain-containing protein [Candidatus Parcubacteria bacterium]|nr:MAG: GGDEF domain-containing protein [Candidatus Parcubacteria bacterium]